MGAEIFLLMHQFFRRFGGYPFIGPDLAVGMGIGAAHDGALIFKHLDMLDEIQRTKLGRLLRPGGKDGFDSGLIQFR